MLGFGVAGFLTTEEVLRKALGESVPREWLEFAAAQGERTRRELAERVADEVGRSLRELDASQLLERLLASHTIEVTARIRLLARDGVEARGPAIQLRVAGEDDA